LERVTRIVTILALASLLAAGCNTGSGSSGSSASTTTDPRDERRDERRDAREAAEERQERRRERAQDALFELPPDLTLDQAAVGLDALPADFEMGGTSSGPAFDEAVGRHKARKDPDVCPRRRTITIGYETLAPENVAGLVVGTPTGSALFIHAVAHLDGTDAGQLWNNFVRLVSSCLSSSPTTRDGDRTATLKVLPSIQVGRASGLGYRQVVTAPDAPATLVTRYFMRNANCVSDIKIVGVVATPDQYQLSDSDLLWAAQALNRVIGCDITTPKPPPTTAPPADPPAGPPADAT
jgi:hypothetical protein